MWNAIVTIPLQIVCQLLVPGQNGTENVSFAVDTQSSKPTRVLPEGYVAFPDIGVAYKYYTEEVTWNSARKTCIADGGALADIDTFEKMKYALKVKKNNESYGLSVGIHRLFDNVEWTSLRTGQSYTMLPWASDSNDETPENKCMLMYYDGRGLTALSCTDTYRFMCEIPLPVDWI